MRTVLGIDAAWTEAQSSGVALAEETASGWRLQAAAISYARFEALAGPAPEYAKPRGMKADANALLATCRHLTGREPDLLAVDMPLSRLPITGGATPTITCRPRMARKNVGPILPTCSGPDP
jgi:hypothetical protein